MIFQHPSWQNEFLFSLSSSKANKEPFDLGLFHFSRNYNKEHVKLIIQVYSAHLNRILLNERSSFVFCFFLF